MYEPNKFDGVVYESKHCEIAINGIMLEDYGRVNWTLVNRLVDHAREIAQDNERRAIAFLQAAELELKRTLAMEQNLVRLSRMVNDGGMWPGGHVTIYGPDRHGMFDITVRNANDLTVMVGGMVKHDDGRWCIHT